MESAQISDWKAYLKWTLLRSTAGYLSSNFVNQDFEFYGKFLNGSKKLQDRWKRVSNVLDGSIGELVGQLYVKDNFPPEAKTRANEVVDNLIASMGESIKNNDWMSKETKEQALVKLNSFGVKIGYPDKWTDYSGLQISNESFFDNVWNSWNFLFKDNVKKIGKPVDKTEWGMTPQTVNAYYSPTRNEIVFPAGILQPPFFGKDADDAINYGAMGAVIGHEITHGFDDEGRQYDADGNIRDWWTEEDAERFDEKAKVLVEQYNKLVALDTLKVDGKLTLGENIADLGGLTISYAAFSKTNQFKEGKEIDGFTPQQRFFLSWAQVWRNNIRDENLKLRLKTDVHSPGKQRVNGPFTNMPQFFKAFNVKEGDKMYRSPNELVKIW
jgi:putative endopeptidase